MYPVGAALAAGLMAWHVYALTVMWGWFVTPLFGLDTPSMSAMGGLFLIWGLLHKSKQPDNDENGLRSSLKYMAICVTRPAAVMLIGWFLK